MEVIFWTKKLERCYMEFSQGRRAWGPEVARKYIQRIDILQEASDMNEVRKLPGLGCHPITLHARWRLIFSLQGDRARIVRVEEVSKHYGD